MKIARFRMKHKYICRFFGFTIAFVIKSKKTGMLKHKALIVKKNKSLTPILSFGDGGGNTKSPHELLSSSPDC